MSPLSDCHFLIANTVPESVLDIHKVGVVFLCFCKCTSSKMEKYWSKNWVA